LKKALFISRDFYPSNCANAKRPFFFAKKFHDEGWNVDILATTRGLEPTTHESIIDDHFKVIRFSDSVRKLDDWLTKRSSKFWKILRSILNGLLWPDVSILWVLKLARWLKGKQYDCIIVFIYPESLLLLNKLVHNISTCWIYDYLEPVSPQMKRYPRKSPIPRLLTPLMEKLEKKTLNKAPLAIFTSESNRKAYIHENLITPNKAVYISHFFDQNLYDPSIKWDGEILNIVYAGSFDRMGRRSPTVFLNALKVFFEKYPEAKKTLIFDFYGHWWSEHRLLVEKLDLTDSVHIYNPLKYSDYLKVLQKSAVLLLITAPEHNLFIPGKLVDYLGAQRPILAFSPIDSETSNVLRSIENKNYLCSNDDVQDGALKLENIWINYKKKKLLYDKNDSLLKYESNELTTQFERTIQNLTS